MALIRSYKRGQGINITGNGKSIDIIVKRVGWGRGNPRVDLEIKGHPKITNIHLNETNSYFILYHCIKIFRGYKQHNRGAIRLIASGPKEYKFEQKNYKTNLKQI
ncbi:MAG: hypothetical protein KKF48_00085 [Nanoarchaeota archaeon]|nr:hypothetical protein [Nanoarchaeota archaeon]MBU1027422.1 hypothetical protein [Nanoarchaeota archaeon]